MQRLTDTFVAVIDLLIPPACLSCNERLPHSRAVLCKSCLDECSAIKANFCQRCGSELSENQCQTCIHDDFEFAFSRSVYRYKGPIQELIHQLKYSGKRSPAQFLADGIATYLADNPEFKDYHAITSIPLHRVRKRERGYNQSELIAREVAKQTGLTYIEPVFRKRYTISQTNLHRSERLKNLKSAFGLKKTADIIGKNIIILDDVFTTGSTLNEVSSLLMTSGAKSIAGLTAARA